MFLGALKHAKVETMEKPISVEDAIFRVLNQTLPLAKTLVQLTLDADLNGRTLAQDGK